MGLQNIRSGRAVGVLIDRLLDKNELPETRQHAAAALASIRSYRAMQELRTRYADEAEDRALRSFIGGELDRVRTLVNADSGPVPSSPMHLTRNRVRDFTGNTGTWREE